MNHYIMAQAIYKERKQVVEMVNEHEWKNHQSPEMIATEQEKAKVQPKPAFKVHVQS